MRSIKIALVLVLVAASVHAEPAVYPELIPDYQKLEPSGAYVYNATDRQWHANSSAYPLYCSVPSGGSGGTIDLTKLNGSTPSAANPLPAQLSDGSAAYTAAKTGQLPTALGANGGLKVEGIVGGVAQPVSGTVAATQSGTWTVQPGNTANTTAWKVDGSAVTQPVTGIATSGAAPPAASVPVGGIGAVQNKFYPAMVDDAIIANGAAPFLVEVLNAASLPLPSGASTSANQTTLNTAIAALGIGNYCTTVPLGVAFDPGASGTDVAATLTGICSGGTCKRLLIQNVSANPCMVQFNSSTGTAGVCVYGGTTTAPYEVDSSRWVSPATGVTNLYATTTGTNSCPTGVTVGACNLHLVGCI